MARFSICRLVMDALRAAGASTYPKVDVRKMEELTRVRILVTHPSPHDPEREETSWHQFYDLAPEFLGTVEAVESYQDTPGVEIKVWYDDPEEKPEFRGTHAGTLVSQ